MRQFIHGTDRDYLILENKAQGKCIRFKNQDMPPGSTPQAAHIGFEIDPRTEQATLLVTNGVRYRGNDRDIANWLQHGEKKFSSFDALKQWIRTTLSSAYGMRQQEPVHTPRRGQGNRQLTDINAVRQQLTENEQASFVDEQRAYTGLQEYVKGQDQALKDLAKVVSRHTARKQPSRPAVLFAVGPSGVGKTRTAESLPKVLKKETTEHNEYQYIRLDMSEYQESHRVSQLIGSPQGYVGYGEGSQLIDKLQSNPKTIVLFDEIEKAHPSILRVLMNAMDAGRLSTASRSSNGHEIDCRFAIFIFTSNLDAQSILDELEERDGFEETTVIDEVCRKKLKAAGIAPEIIGRIGRFLVYKNLSQQDRAEICAVSITEVAEEYGVTVIYIDPGVIVTVLKMTDSNNFGVRPEKYLIDDKLGGLFSTAARANHERIRVTGPPYSYEVAGGKR